METTETTTSPERMLREFHASKAIHSGLMPERPTTDIPQWVQVLRLALLDEEVAELREAVEAGNIVKIADAIGDIAYVVIGTAVAYGVPFDAVFAEVHRSNMTKTNTPAEAKLVKGPDYEPPQIGRVLAARLSPAAAPDIDADPMWHSAYMRVQAVLDEALGAEEKDGLDQGIAADVWLLAHQRDEARAQVAQLAAHLKDLTEPGLLPASGPASVTTDWCIAWGGEDAHDCAGRLEYDDEAEAREMTQWIDGGIVARQTVIRLPWVNVPDETEGE
jgi:hypothetical protein